MATILYTILALIIFVIFLLAIIVIGLMKILVEYNKWYREHTEGGE